MRLRVESIRLVLEIMKVPGCSGNAGMAHIYCCCHLHVVQEAALIDTLVLNRPLSLICNRGEKRCSTLKSHSDLGK